MPKNLAMRKAQKNKNDEFYTGLSDIEKEMKYYENEFVDKVIYCNCDDPVESNFFYYFQQNFYRLGIKKLICTHYDYDIPTSYKLVIEQLKEKVGTVSFIPKETKIPLEENGDFRSEECLKLLEEADIVITNPPFSLWREYVQTLVDYNKKFIILGNINNICYKNIFPLIKDNKIWLGASIHSGDREFRVPDTYPLNASGTRIDENGNRYIRVKGVRWFTNIDYPQRHEDLPLYKKYTPEEFPEYDNYPAINITKTTEIPYDYTGVMGVPITFLDKFNPDQFEIITLGIGKDFFTPTKFYGPFLEAKTGLPSPDKRDYILYVKDPNGKYITEEGYRVNKPFARILIKNKRI